MCFIVRMLNNKGRKLPDAASKAGFTTGYMLQTHLENLWKLYSHCSRGDLVFSERPKNAKRVYFFIMMSRLYYSVVENTDTQ